ncbi:YciI family protein [Caulobacter sp. NIBR2454]|uniref:YciI family protein n=1 Tax=Caulobacter sp. NIBR2454 TaxID=3015996 RepID=UPI0022B622A1|nr:YciI family protein [Caulobacter sp. NIBR2454]
MPYFMLRATDKPGTGDLRLETRPVHLDYLNSLPDVFRMAGALLAEDGQTVVGSLMIIEADDLDSARAYVEGDPFAQAGIFATTEILPWRLAIGKPA